MPNYEQASWVEANAEFDEHTLKILGNQVMEDWELPYMKMLGEIATHNNGDVLEVGYGMGISSAVIESRGVESHVVIEAHPDVLQKCLEDNAEAIRSNRFRIISGFWQNVTPSLAAEQFDGILFDTYPIKSEEMIGPHMYFFKEAYRLLRPNGVLTYYSDEETSLSPRHIICLKDAGFSTGNIDYDVCEVEPPEGCDYWDKPTIVAPIIKK